MPVIDLTIGKILNLIEEIIVQTIGINFELFKSLIFLFSIFYSLNLILFWIYLEMKNKDEIGFWDFILKSYKRFKDLKKASFSYQNVKETYLNNKQEGLFGLRDFFKLALESYGYSGNLEEILNQLNEKILPNLEDVKKAIKAINLIEKNKNNNLSDEEIELLYSTIETALYHLNVIEKEDFLVKIPKLQ